MNTLERQLSKAPSDYVTSSELDMLLQKSENARFSLVKRALHKGILLKLRRGLYRRSDYLEQEKPHTFEMAQHIYWPSYVSLESALSFHELIPEAIYNTTSVTTRRANVFENAFGRFEYHRLPKKNFFLGVVRTIENKHVFFVANPWKAITDYLFCYNKKWTTLIPLRESLRIEIEHLPLLDIEFANKLDHYYGRNEISLFLKAALEYQHERTNYSRSPRKLSMQKRT